MIVHMNDDDIVHYGVKGMRWGVRKERDTSAKTTLSKRERKEAQKIYEDYKHPILKKIVAGRQITDDDYANLSTKDVAIAKNTTLRRVTRAAEEQRGKDISYVSYDPKDADTYRSVLNVGALGKAGAKTYEPSYEVTMKATEALRSPSEKARVDAFTELFDSKSVVLSNGQKASGREYLTSIGFGDEVRTIDAQQIGQRYYYDYFVKTQAGKTPLTDAYYNTLRARGYNALIDDNDRNLVSRSPLILLNPDDSVKKIKVDRLTADDIVNAQRRLEAVLP